MSVSPPVLSEPGMNSTHAELEERAERDREERQRGERRRQQRRPTRDPASRAVSCGYFATMFALNHSFHAASVLARTSSFMM